LSSTPLPASRSSAIRDAAERSRGFSESQATVAVGRLGGWHLRHASIAPLVQAAWSYRHNLTVADALSEQLGASLLTDDHRLVQGPTFPSHVPVLRLPASL
jgi:predicted nucleic acid-binding protein